MGDKLAEIEALIDWEAFRPIVKGMFDNQSEKGGRPNIDEVVMIKMLVLQAWHGLSDPELERQVADRLSFPDPKLMTSPAKPPVSTTSLYALTRSLMKRYTGVSIQSYTNTLMNKVARDNHAPTGGLWSYDETSLCICDNRGALDCLSLCYRCRVGR